MAATNRTLPAIADLLRGIRPADRPPAGRRLLILVAIGLLAGPDGENTLKQELRDAAGRRAGPEEIRATLHSAAMRLGCRRPELRDAFEDVLIDEVMRGRPGLREHLLQAADVIEVFESSNWAGGEFAAWFDRASDTIMEAGPTSGTFVTPRPLARLMVALVGPEPGDRVLDPSCGQGSLLSAARAHTHGLHLLGQDTDPIAVALATVRLSLLGDDASFVLQDGSQAPPRTAGSGFDRVLCDPPRGTYPTAQSPPSPEDAFADCGLGRSESLFVAGAASALRPGGRAVVLVPRALLSRKGPDARLRQRLLQLRCVEGAIDLPKGVSPGTRADLSLLLLERPRGTSVDRPITLLDASDIRLPGKRPDGRLQDPHVREILDAYRLGRGAALIRRIHPRDVDATTLNIEPGSHLRERGADLDLQPTLARIRELDAAASAAARRMAAFVARLGVRR